MKIIPLFFLAMSLHLMSAAQDEKVLKLSVDHNEVDMGLIKKDAEATAVFLLTNDGDAAIDVSECKPTCSCTTAFCPKKHIAPGESAEVVLRYDSSRVGSFHKSVHIYWNNPEGQEVPLIINISGEVFE